MFFLSSVVYFQLQYDYLCNQLLQPCTKITLAMLERSHIISTSTFVPFYFLGKVLKYCIRKLLEKLQLIGAELAISRWSLCWEHLTVCVFLTACSLRCLSSPHCSSVLSPSEPDGNLSSGGELPEKTHTYEYTHHRRSFKHMSIDKQLAQYVPSQHAVGLCVCK